jgi:NAD-dependent SIR2 family protein deacetylase
MSQGVNDFAKGTGIWSAEAKAKHAMEVQRIQQAERDKRVAQALVDNRAKPANHVVDPNDDQSMASPDKDDEPAGAKTYATRKTVGMVPPPFNLGMAPGPKNGK